MSDDAIREAVAKAMCCAGTCCYPERCVYTDFSRKQVDAVIAAYEAAQAVPADGIYSAEALYAVNTKGNIFLVEGRPLSWVDDVPTEPGLYSASHQITVDETGLVTVWKQAFALAADRSNPVASDLELAREFGRYWFGPYFMNDRWDEQLAQRFAGARRAGESAMRERCLPALRALVKVTTVLDRRDKADGITHHSVVEEARAVIRALPDNT